MEGPNEKAALLVEKLAAISLTAVAAESCTAGLVADLIARVPGASRVFWGSFVSYMPEAKVLMLGLDRERLDAYGPVSRETACSMAEAALEKSGAGIAVGITGLAGPGGDGTAVPVGTVWIATAVRDGETRAEIFHFKDSRNNIRNRAAVSAIEALLKRL
jgi:PncC family amidohydrolase